MVKNYIIITKNVTQWFDTEEKFLAGMQTIRTYNNSMDGNLKIEVLFAGKVKIEQEYDDVRNILVNI